MYYMILDRFVNIYLMVWCSLYRGGTILTVSGESMDSVEAPKVEITITKQSPSSTRMKKVTGVCICKNTKTYHS